MEGDLENHSKAPLFRLVQWLNIIRFLHETSPDVTDLKRKFYLEYSSDMSCTREGIWKGDIFGANIEELEKIDTSEIYRRRINAKEILTP